MKLGEAARIVVTYSGKWSKTVQQARNKARRIERAFQARQCTCHGNPMDPCGYCEAQEIEAENRAMFPPMDGEERE